MLQDQELRVRKQHMHYKYHGAPESSNRALMKTFSILLKFHEYI